MFFKCLLLFCTLFILGAKCDCDGYFECFNMFFSNFFVGNPDNVEYVNYTSKNLPENFVEVKDVNVGDLGKVLSEISSFIHQDITEKLNTQSGATFSNINPDTKIYIKTFNYNFDDLQHVNINKGDIKKLNEVKIEAETSIPSNDNKSVLGTDTMTRKVDIINKANHKQISENLISETDGISYYDSIEDNSTDYPIIDYVDLYKDVTNEENVYETTQASLIKDNIQMTYDEYVVGLENIILDINNNSDPINATDIPEIYPWITTIFIKNESKNDQFDYFCDGALLSDKTLITAARCVYLNNTVMNADDILVILGKTSLLIMDDKERPVKVKQIIIHDNFTNVNGKIENDLALLIFEEAVDFNEIIQATAIGNDTKDVKKLVTTAWNLKGEIVPVFLDDMENKECNSRNAGKHMFCAKFGQDVALCPSYGGVFAAKEDDSWYIYGIRSGDTADRGLCFDKHLWFTDLRKYDDWITENWE